MKKLNVIIISFICALMAFTACNDEFLERLPETTITDQAFFQTASDLELFVNGFYDERNVLVPRNVHDIEQHTDNIANYERFPNKQYCQILMGQITANNAGGWGDWGVLRSINFFLANAPRATGDEATLKHWIGIGHYCRAIWYIAKVSDYSDVAWINKPLTTDDPDVFRPSDPRALVVDSILKDLDYACTHIKPNAPTAERTTIDQYVALALKSRFCLYEGTFRKYHPELKLESTANSFLTKSVEASEQIMNSGNFELVGKGTTGFLSLFSSLDLTGNREMILFGKYVDGRGDGISTFVGLDREWCLSRSLMETFLNEDGSRFTDDPNNSKKPYTQIFENRDPRFKGTFVYPGYRKPGESSDWVISLVSRGGWGQLKRFPGSLEALGGGGWRTCWNDDPIFRYAEVLLNYAEAKAELGTITDADLNKSINLVKGRVDMPAITVAGANTNPDPFLVDQYPNVTGANKGLILEIRRERRVEMACEGIKNEDSHRSRDIQRWAVGELLERKPQGIYIEHVGVPFDVTGDGIADIVILNSETDPAPPEGVKAYYMTVSGFYLSDGDHGFIMFNADNTTPRHFQSPKYYYLPIPITNLNVNPALKQQEFWR